MKTSNAKHDNFIPLPAALLPVLSDRALRVLLYASDREGLVRLGKLNVWKLYPKKIREEFKHHRGYSRNSLALAIRELQELGLIEFRHDHYVLNTEELKKWFGRSRRKNPPVVEMEGVPNPGEGVLPKSGDQEKKSIREESIRKETIKEESTRNLEPGVKDLEKRPEQKPPAIDFDEQDLNLEKVGRKLASGRNLSPEEEMSPEFVEWFKNL